MCQKNAPPPAQSAMDNNFTFYYFRGDTKFNPIVVDDLESDTFKCNVSTFSTIKLCLKQKQLILLFLKGSLL